MFKSDEIIVFTNGCFDLLHDGHMYLLNECNKLGDKLVVAINSDESVKRLKGEQRPIQSENERKNNLLDLDIVDKVIIFNDDTPYRVLEEIRPDILVKGDEYNYDDIVGRDLVKKVVRIPMLEGFSTTNLIQKGT
jgi:D-beta-D-heptose 7-phosphate kinase / D-beta-D-heptose 1-phosphate adenosyltransferase